MARGMGREGDDSEWRGRRERGRKRVGSTTWEEKTKQNSDGKPDDIGED